MKFRKHATQQAQRRGIREDLVEFVVSHGEEFKVGRGARIYRVKKTDIGFLKEECPPAMWKRYRDRLRSVASLVSKDQEIVTAMHRYKPLWKQRNA